MAEEALLEFFVKLGWQTDVASENRFTDAITKAVTNIAKLTTAFEAAAVASTKVVERIANKLEGLSYASERLFTSIENIKAFQFAMSQVGSTSAAALALLESVGSKLRNQPGVENYINQTFNVLTRDAKGHFRQLTDILEEVINSPAFQKADYYVKKEMFETIGGNELAMQAMMRDHSKWLQEYHDKAKAFHLDLEKAGEEARHFMDAWRSVWATATTMLEKLGADFEERLGGRLRAFDEWLSVHGKGVIEGIKSVYAVVETLAGAIGSVMGAVGDLMTKYLDPWAATTLGIYRASDKFLGALIAIAGIGGIGLLANSILALVSGAPFMALTGTLGALGLGGAALAGGALLGGGALAAGAIASRGGVGPWADKVRKDWGPGGRAWHPGSGGGGPGILGSEAPAKDGAAGDAGSAGFGGKSVPGADLSGVDKRLNEIIEAASKHLKEGYTVKATSGFRGGNNQSFHGKGMAEDVQIFDPQGNPIPNRGEDTTGMYARLARAAYGETKARYPELIAKHPGSFERALGWGGAFGTQLGGGGVQDLMHFDLGGERGKWSEHYLSRMGELPGHEYGAPAKKTPSFIEGAQAAGLHNADPIGHKSEPTSVNKNVNLSYHVNIDGSAGPEATADRMVAAMKAKLYPDLHKKINEGAH